MTAFNGLVADYEGLVGLLDEKRTRRLGLAETLTDLLVEQKRMEGACLAVVVDDWATEKRSPNNEALRLAEADQRLLKYATYTTGVETVKKLHHEVGVLDIDIESAVYRLSLLKRRMDFEIAIERDVESVARIVARIVEQPVLAQAGGMQ